MESLHETAKNAEKSVNLNLVNTKYTNFIHNQGTVLYKQNMTDKF